MSVINLALDNDVDVIEITHRLNAASVMRFSVPKNRADQLHTGFSANQRVSYVTDGHTLFTGRVLPQGFQVSSGSDLRTYVAVDILEWLAHNPAEIANQFYNVVNPPTQYSVYPANQTLRQILEEEWDTLINDEMLLTLNWDDANGLENIVVPDFSPIGKTWLGILDALLTEIPALAYFYDHDTVDAGETTGGVLRIIDTTNAPAVTSIDRMPIVFPKSGSILSSSANVESFDIKQDISRSYDNLILRGRGDYEEVEGELLTRQWSLFSIGSHGDASGFAGNHNYGGLPRALFRQNPNLNIEKPDVYNANLFGGGDWDNAWDDTVLGGPWYPNKPRVNDFYAFRRYRAASAIANFKLERNPATGIITELRDVSDIFRVRIPRVRRREFLATPANNYAATLTFRVDGVNHNGSVSAGRRQVAYTNGQVDEVSGMAIVDFGDVVYPQILEDSITPNIDDVFQTWFLSDMPQMTDRDILFPDPIVARLDYYFPSIAGSVPSDVENIPLSSCYTYFNIGTYVFLDYVAENNFEAVYNDATRGWDRTLLLHDFRLMKYTDSDSTVIRDDTALLDELGNVIFNVINKPKYTGSCSIHVESVDDALDWGLGKFVRIFNFNNPDNDAIDYWSPESPIREVNLHDIKHSGRLSISLESDVSFDQDEIARRLKIFTHENKERGVGGLGGGSAGISGSIGAGSSAFNRHQGQKQTQGGMTNDGFPPPPPNTPASPSSIQLSTSVEIGEFESQVDLGRFIADVSIVGNQMIKELVDIRLSMFGNVDQSETEGTTISVNIAINKVNTSESAIIDLTTCEEQQPLNLRGTSGSMIILSSFFSDRNGDVASDRYGDVMLEQIDTTSLAFIDSGLQVADLADRGRIVATDRYGSVLTDRHYDIITLANGIEATTAMRLSSAMQTATADRYGDVLTDRNGNVVCLRRFNN